MNRKNIIIILSVFMLLFIITNVSAADTNTTDDKITISDTDLDSIEENTVEDVTTDLVKDAEVKSTNDNTYLSSDDNGTYSDLVTEIGSGGDIVLSKKLYTYDSGDTIEISTSGTIDGNGAVIDMANSSIRVFAVSVSNVTFKNLTIKNSNYDGNGGAVYFNSSDSSVTGCSFVNNTASYGAVYFCESGSVFNCSFVNNTASYGGAVYFYGLGSVVNSRFVNNIASSGGAICLISANSSIFNCSFVNNKAYSNDGGAIYLTSGSLVNCSFVNSTASKYGGAIYLNSGSVVNCSFVNSTASYGGAVYFYSSANVVNCSFVNNIASNRGGAFYMSQGSVINCSFVNNKASKYGGAIYGSGSVFNCSFFNNKASYDGGAIYLNSGSVVNCSFVKNTADSAGAIFGSGSVVNCSFINNTASDRGGAIYVSGSVVNCTFTGNVACDGGAICLISGSVVNCSFVKNRAYDWGGAIYYINSGGYVINSNFIKNTATKTGGAIRFSDGGNSAINCSFVNNTASYGGAIYSNSGSVVNCSFVNNIASDYGGAVFFYGSCSVVNCSFVNNKASSNDAGAVYGSGSVINCNFVNNTASNQGGAVYGSVKVVNCSFDNNIASSDSGGAIYLSGSGSVVNSRFVNNIANITSGAICFTSADSSIFNCSFVNNTASYGGAIYSNSGSVVNCSFVNNKATDSFYGGGAIYSNSGSVVNCNFVNNTVSTYGGAIYFYGIGSVTGCSFVNNSASNRGGAIYFNGMGSVVNSCFINNIASSYGGAVYSYDLGTAFNCSFVNNTASYGGAVSFYSTGSSVTGCSFVSNSVSKYGGAVNFGSSGSSVVNCSFISNTASSYGGAVYFSSPDSSVVNCSFVNNTASYGGAVYFSGSSSVVNCSFVNNKAFKQGGAVFMYSGSLVNCSFVNNKASSYGGAVFFTSSASVFNCSFVSNAAYSAGAVFFSYPGSVVNCSFVSNTASYCGAINFFSSGTVINCSFINNKASKQGGALCFIYYNNTVTGCIFANNTANDGAAIYVMESTTLLTVNNSSFINNTVYAIYNLATLSLANNTIDSIIYNGGKIVTEMNATFMDNEMYTAYVGDIYTLNATLTDGNGNKIYDPNFIFTVDDEDIEGITFDNQIGLYQCDYYVKNLGLKLITTSYDGIDASYIHSNILNILKGNVTLTVSTGQNNKFAYSDNVTIFISLFNKGLFEGLNETIYLIVNNTKIPVETTNGYASYNISGLDPNEYNITAIFEGNSNYNASKNNSTIFYVLNKDKILSIEVESIKYGESAFVNITITDAYGNKSNGTVVLIVCGSEYVVRVTGNASYEIKNLDANTEGYIVNATLQAEYLYAEIVNDTEIIKVTQADSSVTIDEIENVTYGGTVEVYYHIENKTSVNITVVDLNNPEKLITYIDDTFSVIIADLPAGNYKITIHNADEGNYKESEANATFYVTAKEVDPDDITVVFTGNAPDVSVTVTGPDANYTIEIYAENGTVEDTIIVEVVNGTGSASITNLAAGNKTANVTIDSNYKLSSAIPTQEFKYKYAPQDYNATFTAVYPEVKIIIAGGDGEYIVSIENLTATITVSNGTGTGIITGLTPGNYDVSVEIDETDTTNYEVKWYSVEVTKADPTFTSTVSENNTVGENVTIIVYAPGDATGKVSLSVDGEIISTGKILNNGTVVFTVADLTAGQHLYNVTYEGDSNYNLASDSNSFDVYKVNSTGKINITYSIPTDKSTVVFTLRAPSDATGYLMVDINGESYYSEVINGTASVTVTGLTNDNYKANVSYSGDGKYTNISKSLTVTLNHLIKLEGINIKALYSAKAYYKVLLIIDGSAVAGKKVTFTYAGKTYSATTDSKGYATIKLNTKVKPASYKVTAKYGTVSTSNTVKVKNIIKAKNKKVKKSKKVTKIAIKLKKVNGKYINKAKLKIKFKGKTYKVKTNKKGKAKWKVKKSMIKKLKAGKKYKYTVTYGKDTVTKKLKIKK